ncbi:MAG: c-type cytochrome [Bacteroidia bacterium]
MKKIIISTILLSTVFLTGCYYDKEEQLYPNSGNNTNCDSVLTYNTGIKTLIDANCANCHKPGGNTPDLTTYALVKANIDLVKKWAITDKKMPASGMTTCNFTKLDNWIKAGAKEN